MAITTTATTRWLLFYYLSLLNLIVSIVESQLFFIVDKYIPLATRMLRHVPDTYPIHTRHIPDTYEYPMNTP